LNELQDLADRIFAGEVVEIPLRGRSAFHAAVLATLLEVDHALSPRRFWLKDVPGTFDREYDELFPEEDPATAREGREVYHRHRVRERSPLLCKLKKETVLREEGRLGCEACRGDFERQYGELGQGVIECHHRFPLGEGEERETTLEDLALLCANCHRVIHRSKLTLSVEELQRALRDADGEA
jgi:predicted HNH restriction endonuclease